MSEEEVNTNGVTNGVNKPTPAGLYWKVGLINSAQKYFTAESFGFKVNASGTALKKKQTWILEQDLQEEVIYIRSHLDRYLSADKYGKVTCESEDRTDTEKFAIEYSQDGNFSFRSVTHGYYLGGTEEKVQCFAKKPSEKETWAVQLCIHPQVNLRNVNRKRYAHLANEEIQCSEVVPWGADSLIILEFKDGKYALKTSDNRYLHRDGTLVDTRDKDTCFTMEIKSGVTSGLAFKDVEGRYLTGVGPMATMKARNKTISKDELFTIEDSNPQVVLTAQNGKKMSIRQGLDVSANQDEEEDTEIFQIEHYSGKWAIRASSNKYWSLEMGGGIQAKSVSVNPNCLFDIEWLGDGTAALKAANNCYVLNKPTGSLIASGDSMTDNHKIQIKIVNRPLLVLKCDHGFVGIKPTGSQKSDYICNKSTYDVIFLEGLPGGKYALKDKDGQYWSVGSNNAISANGSEPTPFVIEFRGQSMVTIRAPNHCYLKGEQNGLFRAIEHEISKDTLWEY